MVGDDHTELLKSRARRSAREQTPSKMGELGDTGVFIMKAYLLEVNKKLTYILESALPQLKIKTDEKAINAFYEDRRNRTFDEIYAECYNAEVKADAEMKRREAFIKGIVPQLFTPIYQGKERKWEDEIRGEGEGFEDERVKLRDLIDAWHFINMYSDKGLDATIDNIVAHYPDGTVLTPIKFSKPGKKTGTFITWTPEIVLKLKRPKVILKK